MLLTGLSGNEIYCLAQKGWSPGDVVLGNSVHSLGFVRGLASGFQTMAGGELDQHHRTHLRRPARRHQAHGRGSDAAPRQRRHRRRRPI